MLQDLLLDSCWSRNKQVTIFKAESSNKSTKWFVTSEITENTHPVSDICQRYHVHKPSKFGTDGDPFPSLLVPVTTTVIYDEERQDEDGLNLCS